MRKTASPLAQVECYNNRYDYKLLMEDRVPGTRWVVLRYPHPGHGPGRPDVHRAVYGFLL